MSLSSVLEHPGLALYSIPVMYGLAFLPAIFRNATVTRSVGYDNVAPRSNIARVRDAEVAALVKRMDGAHQNGLEMSPLWAAAVLAGSVAKVDTYTMNLSAVAFITLRALYIFVYVKQTTLSQSVVRSLLWISATGTALNLALKAAGKMGGA